MFFNVETVFKNDTENTDKYCSWSEASELFQKLYNNTDVYSCRVYYYDSKGCPCEVLTYETPRDV